MKKLQLKALELGAREVLTRAQLKNVLGGSGSTGANGAPCNSSDDCSGGGTCYAGACHGGSTGCGGCQPPQVCSYYLGVAYCA